MARTFKGYASAYSAHQTQTRRVRRFQKHTLTVDFNGSILPGRTIESVTWDCTSPWSTFMQNPTISTDQRSVSVDVSFNYSGWAWVKATATLDDGSATNYEFVFTVTDGPMYPLTNYLSNSGPFSVTATA